jgi:hypothetical protein
MDMPEFKERKTAQVAALLAKHSGGEIDVYKLLKLIYLIDREALKRWGVPVTYDRHCNLPHGPTPSHTYDLVKDRTQGKTWEQYFSDLQTRTVIRLENEGADNSELSRAEMALIRDIFNTHGGKSFAELRDLVHSFPEFQDPAGSSVTIDYEDILKAVGWDGNELEDIKKELAAVANFEKMIG